jgi:DNA-binding response OmpR family regulator
MRFEMNEILVVVHEPDQRERIAGLLTDEGFATTKAADGLTALRALGDRRFAMVVAATDLPGSLHAAIVRHARRRNPRLKILYTGEAATRPAFGNPDIDDFIAMPFDRHELIGCVFELLHRSVAAGAADLGRRVRAELNAS